MPDPQSNPALSERHATPDPATSLDSAVDDLLTDLNATAGESSRSPDARDGDPASAPHPVANPVADPVADPGTDPGADPGTDPGAEAERALDDARTAADALLEQAADDLAATLAEPPVDALQRTPRGTGDHSKPDTPENLLDAAVSTLLDGSFESPDGDLVDVQGTSTTPDPALLLDETGPPPAPLVFSRTDAPQPSAVPAKHPAPSTKPVRLPTPTARVVETEPDPDPGLAIAGDRAEPRPSRPVGAAAGVSASIGARALMLLSKPLESQPPRVRDSVGWVALWTVFLAVCVWATVLLRSAPVRHDDGTASRVVTPDTPEPFPPPKAQDSHGAPAGGHDAKPAGAHAAPAPSHGAKPAAHAPKAGGHH